MNKLTKLKAITGHIKTVSVHKYYVFLAMKDCGHPIQGLLHDMSKFSPTEFGESIEYYTGTHSPIDGARAELGYSMAWLHHKGRNPHHSQYWIDYTWGVITVAKMPWKYLVESICDTIGAGKAYMKDKWTINAPIDWWNSRDCKSIFNDKTRKALQHIYSYIAKNGWERTAELIKLGVFEEMYEHDSF
jgi:hypothetical protein